MENLRTKLITIDGNLIAKCGLYCGSCSSYLKGKCPGCDKKTNAAWCKVRECCTQNDFKCCSECVNVDVKDCAKFNNLISKLIGILLNSDRNACIERIRELGYEPYAAEMAQYKIRTIKKSKIKYNQNSSL